MKKNTSHTQPLSPPAGGKAGEGLIIYHHPHCSKSREAYRILQNLGLKFETIQYLKSPLKQKEIKELLEKLGLNASDIVRKGEAVFKEKFAGKKLSESEWVKALAENPILIERPIIVIGSKAIIAKPSEKVLEFLK